MKNFLLCFVAVCAVVLSSCEGAETVVEPKLELTSKANIRLSADSNEVVITYTIANPIADEVVSVDLVNDAMFESVDSSQYGAVSVVVTENLSEDVREGAIIVKYLSESLTVKVEQEGNSGAVIPVERVEITATQLIGTYYGDYLAEGLGHYWIILSNGGIVDGEVLPNTEFFRFDILGPLAADIEAIKVPDGKYTYDFYNNFKEYTILNLGNSDYTYVDDAGEGWAINFDSAELIVEGNRFELVALVENKEFHVSFEGDYTIGNTTISDSISNLTSDLEIDVSNCDVTLNSYGDYWLCGYCNWVVEFISKKGLTNGVYLVLDLLGTTLDTSSGFVGTYTSAGFEDEEHRTPNFGPGVFVPGVRISDNGVYMQGSLYQRYDNGKGIEQAPLHDGTITISDNGDGTYRILVDAIDDCTPAHKITLDWSGVL